MFSFDILPFIMPSVEKIITKERSHMDSIYDVIDEFIKKESFNLVLSGQKSLNMLLHEAKVYDYQVYCTNALFYANQLANLLAESVKDYEYIIVLSTVIPYQKFLIKVEGRPLVEVNALPKSFQMEKFIKPRNIDGFNVIPPILQLISIFQDLYNPEKADEWDALREVAEKVIPLSPISGAKEGPNSIFMKNFIKLNPEILLIGDTANTVLNNVQHNDTLEIITALDTNFIFKEFQKYYLKPLTMKTSNLLIFSDYRLEKTVVKNDKRTVMVIYNSAHYELVPYFKHGNYNIANKYVLLRFAVIDMFNINMLAAMERLDHAFAERRLAQLSNNYRHFAIMDDIKENFIGRIVDPSRELKIKKQESRLFMDYYPQKYMQSQHSYRVI